MQRSLLLALFVLSIGSAAQADLTGATVNVSAYFPDTNTLFTDPGDVMVSEALEYPAGSFDPFTNSIAIDITATQIILEDTNRLAFPATPAEFNGYILQVATGPEITTATVDPASDFVPVELTVANGELRINYQGIESYEGPGNLSIINYTAVPEPHPIALAATGLVVLAASPLLRSRGRKVRELSSGRIGGS